MLAIYVERTATEIKEWLRGFEPHGYEPFNDVELHWMGQSLKRLWIEDRRLMFSNQCSNHPTSQAVDSTLLGSVCDGALGEELSWDFIDDDYRTYVATGHDLGSLREYLHARGPGLERFEAGYETVSCTGSEDLHALAARMREGDLSQVPRNLRIVLPPDLHKDWERNASVREVLTSRSRVRFTLSATELS